MKMSSAMAMLLRSPVKTLVTAVLIAAVTFGFFSQIFEYVTLSQEMAHLAELYRITGTVEADEPPAHRSWSADALTRQIFDKTKWAANIDMSKAANVAELHNYMRQYGALSQSAMESIAASPHVSATSTRFMTAGVGEYDRIDGNEYFFDYPAGLVGEGVVERAAFTQEGSDDHRAVLVITLTGFTLLAGDSGWLPDDASESIMVRVLLYRGDTPSMGYSNDSNRRQMFFSANYPMDFADNIQPGERLIFRGRVRRGSDIAPMIFIGGITDYWCDDLRIVTDEPEDYLDKDEFESFRQAIEITNADLHTFDMVYTDDIMSIPRFADRMIAISQGRALTPLDEETRNCVVSDRFLTVNNLSIGDTITMQLGDKLFDQHAGLGAVASVPERYQRPVETVELTIVGSYVHVESQKEQAESMYHTYSVNTIFVPLTLLPQSANTQNHQVKPGEFSFALDHPNNFEAFAQDIEPFLTENGLTLLPGSNAAEWRKISADFNSSSKVTMITVGIFFLAILSVGMLVSFLYITRRRQEYAIMRALGTTGKEAGKSLFVPLLTLGMAAAAVGVAISWGHTKIIIDGIAAQYADIQGYTFSLSMPPLVVIGSALICIASFVVPALLMLRKLRNTQPLVLLQGQQETRKKRVEEPGIATELPVAISIQDLSRAVTSDKGHTSAVRFVLRYVARHSRRVAVKSLLSILLPALLFGLVGQSAVMREKYAQLQQTIPLTGYFAGEAPAESVLELAAKPYLRESYYSGGLLVQIGGAEVWMAVASDLERYMGGEEIIYAEGYDGTMGEGVIPCVAGEGLMKAHGFSFGDEIELFARGTYGTLGRLMLNECTRKYLKMECDGVDQAIGDLANAAQELAAQGRHDDAAEIAAAIEGFYAAIEEARVSLIIAGKVVSDDANMSDQFIALAGEWCIGFAGAEPIFEEAEFTLADNAKANLFRDDGGRYVARGRASSPHLQFVLDLSALESAQRNGELIDKLFPFILLAAVFIAALFQVLMILQLGKDVGKMRVLGTTVARICAMLGLERMALFLLGFVLAVTGLAIFHGAALGSAGGVIALGSALFLASGVVAAMATAVIVSMRSPLEAIQLKE